MIVHRRPQEVSNWLIAFFPETENRWVRMLVPGRYKHVAAFAYAADCRTWVWYEWGWNVAKIRVLPDDENARMLISAWTAGATVVRMDVLRHERASFRVGMWCVPAVKHLVGLRSGALLPDALLRDCVKAGAEVIIENGENVGVAAESSAARSGSC